MKKYISIPKPCHEDWDTMTPKEQGRHCDKCNLQVKDFTNMSDQEVLNYFKKNTGRVCGRVNQNQLYTPSTLDSRLKKFLYALAVVFLPFLPIITIGQSGSDVQIEKRQNATSIQGKLVNQDGHPIPYASINIYEGGVLTGYDRTNLNGIYKVKLTNPGNYDMKISSIGYETIDIKSIALKNKQTLRLDMPPMIVSKRMLSKVIIKARPNVIMGGASLHGICAFHDEDNTLNEQTEFRKLDPFRPNRQILYNYELRQMGR